MKLLILLTFITLSAKADDFSRECHYELVSTNEVDYCTQGGCRYKEKKVLVCNEEQCLSRRVIYDDRGDSRAIQRDSNYDCTKYPRGSGACM